MAIDVFYCDQHEISLPPGHKFPVLKYRLIREALESNPDIRLSPSSFVSIETLGLVHSLSYIEAFIHGNLEPLIVRRIGLPWSPGLVDRTLASVGGTLLAAAVALEKGFGGTLAGGTHHAFRSEGAGFCVFNDIAVATEWLRIHHQTTRIAIIDLDVHQGDGTAAIFENDPGVFTLSLHGAGNFPFRKRKSSLDMEFPDGTTDQHYLDALVSALQHVWRFEPQFVFYQSGVDTLRSDKLGRLALTPARPG